MKWHKTTSVRKTNRFCHVAKNLRHAHTRAANTRTSSFVVKRLSHRTFFVTSRTDAIKNRAIALFFPVYYVAMITARRYPIVLFSGNRVYLFANDRRPCSRGSVLGAEWWFAQVGSAGIAKPSRVVLVGRQWALHAASQTRRRSGSCRRAAVRERWPICTKLR